MKTDANRRSYDILIETILFVDSPVAPDKYQDLAALQTDIVHSSLLEELIFWTFKYEFPQNFVCFLLNMLPDPEYKVSKNGPT